MKLAGKLRSLIHLAGIKTVGMKHENTLVSVQMRRLKSVRPHLPVRVNRLRVRTFKH